MKRLDYSFHFAAEEEIDKAVAYYGREAEGLGKALLLSFFSSLDLILDFPRMSPVVRGRVRRKLIEQFPYSIFYVVKRTEVRILAFAHHKRRPFYWVGRS